MSAVNRPDQPAFEPRLWYSPGYPCGCRVNPQCAACLDDETQEQLQVQIGGQWLSGNQCSDGQCGAVAGTYVVDFEDCFSHQQPGGDVISEARYSFDSGASGISCDLGVTSIEVRIFSQGEIIVDVVLANSDLHIYHLAPTGNVRDCMNFSGLDIPLEDNIDNLCNSDGSTVAISSL